MDIENNFLNLVEKAEQDAVGLKGTESLSEFLRHRYEVLTQSLFPNWKAAGKKSVYRELAKFLRENGYPSLTDETLGQTFRRVERSLGARRGKKPPAVATRGQPPSVVPSQASGAPGAVDFSTVDRDWTATKAMASNAQAWTDDLDEAWRHLMWIAEQEGWNSRESELLMTWKQRGGDSLGFAWFALKEARKKLLPQK